MKSLNFRKVHRLAVIYRWCLSLILAGIILLGAAGSTFAASPPEIKAFSAEPLTLKDGDSALYTFVVQDATNIQVIESGEVIKEINGPASTTYKGTVRGRTTYQIRTGDSNTFDTLLVAGNGNGKQERKLTLSFATVIPPKTVALIPPVSDNGSTKSKSPEWLPQSYSAPAATSYTPPASANRSPPTEYPPGFAECPGGCDYCLSPDEAASRGFTRRCSDQPCYFSPDKQQYWYCYSKPETVWCCKDGRIFEATKEQCVQSGGMWFAAEAEAIKACQPATCWCCAGGKVGQTTPAQCAQMGGACYDSQSEAVERCQQMTTCWCCANGKVYQTTRTQCAQMGGACFATQTEASRACQPQTCWCCAGGKVFQSTPAQCAQSRGTCFSTQAEASRACQPQTCWCCAGGKVFQSTPAQCAQSRGTCFSTQAEASRACQQYQLK